MTHNAAICPICQRFRQRVMEGDEGLTCVHSGEPCELCLTTAEERAA